jgi:hypothetical protein
MGPEIIELLRTGYAAGGIAGLIVMGLGIVICLKFKKPIRKLESGVVGAVQTPKIKQAIDAIRAAIKKKEPEK